MAAARYKWFVLVMTALCGFLPCTLGQVPSPRCTDSQRRVVAVGSSIKLQCSVSDANLTIIWRNEQTNEEVQCPPFPASCSATSGVRTGATTSELTVTVPSKREGSFIVKCQSIKEGSLTNNTWYYIDAIIGSPSTCKAAFNTRAKDDWRAEGNCIANNIFSADRCYSCDWLEEKEAEKVKIIPDNYKNLTLTDNSDGTVNMTCGFSTPIPTAKGRYTYLAKITPLALDVKVTDPGGGVIDPPSTPTHDCPTYVPEGTNLACTCKTCSLGTPVGTLGWTQASDSPQLQVSNVRRENEGTTYTCKLQLGQAVHYKLRVAYGPAAAYIAATRPTDSHTDLLCIPLDVNPTPSFVWRARGTGHVLGTDQMLSGVEVSNLHDGNVIECTVTNSENNGKSVTAFVDLEALRLNPNITLVLSAVHTSDEGNTLGTGIAIGITSMLVVMMVLTVIGVIVLRRRQWILPCTDDDKISGSKRPRDSGDGRRKKSGLQLTVTGLSRHSSDSLHGEEVDRPPGADNYEALRRQKGGSPDPYTSLGAQNSSIRGRSPYIDDTGPLYENRVTLIEAAKDSPVYANSYNEGNGFRL